MGKAARAGGADVSRSVERVSRGGEVEAGGVMAASRRGEIPDIVIRRLPIYARTLRELRDSGVTSISSEDLGARLGVTAAQIRRDLSYFGRFGKQGKGYGVANLSDQIAQILHLDHLWDAALVGFGHLGQAIAHYRGFEPNGFRIAAIFARNPAHVGQQVNGVVVLPDRDITAVVQEMGIRIGIIAVQAESAQTVADALIDGGIRAILNYAPVILRLPAGVWSREVDPTSALQSLTYYLEPSDGAAPGREHATLRHGAFAG